MRSPFIISAFIVISFLTFSCSKDKIEQIDTTQLWDCFKSQNYDSAKLASKLIGTWKWTKYYAEIPGTNKANKDVFMNLTKEGSFVVTENSIVITQGNWKLRVVDFSNFELDLNKPSIYLYGRIVLCDNQVLFNNSYIDGSDNLFVRTDY
jgi:hypothetical protein